MRNMSKQAKMVIQDRNSRERKNPSFSSTLLDEIYRSMDEGAEKKSGDLNFHRETTAKRHSRRMDVEEEEDMKGLPRPCLIKKWMDKQLNDTVIGEGRQIPTEFDPKSQIIYDHDLDQDGVLFSSTSISSDSSFGGFSTSDSESINGTNSFKISCFAPPWLKPIRTGVLSRPEKAEKKQRALFDDYRCDRNTEKNPDYIESMIKSKSRAVKIYSHLKKVKDPISPGGRVASFLNSLFTTGMATKTKNSSSTRTSTTCSSASSFSRSCMSKQSLSAGERVRNGSEKRTVRFYPVSVIVDEDCKPCGHKSLCEEKESTLMAAPATIGRRSGRLSRREEERELEFHVKEKKKIVKDAAKEILRGFESQRDNHGEEEEEEEEDDDTESCSSSDLFELDHHAILELPVYETTRFDTNLVIANGLSL